MLKTSPHVAGSHSIPAYGYNLTVYLFSSFGHLLHSTFIILQRTPFGVSLYNPGYLLRTQKIIGPMWWILLKLLIQAGK